MFLITLRAKFQVLAARRLLDFSWNWVRTYDFSQCDDRIYLEFRTLSGY
jgi:hypothetical protein